MNTILQPDPDGPSAQVSTKAGELQSFKGTCQQLTLALADYPLHIVNVKFSG